MLYIAILAGALACSAPARASAEEPRLPSVGGGGGENLTVGIRWGLYEEIGTEDPDHIGVVGAPMPFIIQLEDSGANRLFVFIQHRVANGPYCAETPAQLEDVSVALTAAEGNPTIPGPEYSKTYVWTPTEAGEFVLCAYLDANASGHPTEINFVKLVADAAPGQLSFAISPDGLQSSTVKVEGTAVVASELAASAQEQGLPCTLPEGRLAGLPLIVTPSEADAVGTAVAPGGAAGAAPIKVAQGPFAISYTFASPRRGNYEVCASLTPASTETMYFGRPYELGSAAFTLPGEAPKPRVLPAQESGLPPTLSGVSMSATRFHVAGLRKRGSSDTPSGTTFRFVMPARGRITIAIARLLPGSQRGHRCVPLGAAGAATRAHRCIRRVAIGSIARTVAAGADTLPFNGMVNQNELTAGSYVATLTAHDEFGSSGSSSLRFSVAR